MSLFDKMEGVEGQVTVPGLGAVAGVIGQWTLRREDGGPNAGLYRLRAALSYVNEPLMTDGDFRKEASLLFRRNRATGSEERIVVSGGSLSYAENRIDIEGASVHVITK